MKRKFTLHVLYRLDRASGVPVEKLAESRNRSKIAAAVAEELRKGIPPELLRISENEMTEEVPDGETTIDPWRDVFS